MQLLHSSEKVGSIVYRVGISDFTCVQLRKNTNLLLNEKNSLVRRAKEKTERELDCRIFTLTKQKQKLQVNKTKSVILKSVLRNNIIY